LIEPIRVKWQHKKTTDHLIACRKAQIEINKKNKAQKKEKKK
jgi:hypothetical protein